MPLGSSNFEYWAYLFGFCLILDVVPKILYYCCLFFNTFNRMFYFSILSSFKNYSQEEDCSVVMMFTWYFWTLFFFSSGNIYSNQVFSQISCSVVSNSLQPHGLQHARFPCPSLIPGAYSNSCPSNHCYSNSCPSSRWCHSTISSSVIPFSHLQSFPASGFFPMSQFFTLGGQSTGVSASASILPMNIQGWLPLMDWLDLLAVQRTRKSLLQHHSSKASIIWSSAFFIVQLSHLYMITGKTIALDRCTFVGKVTSLLLNILSRLVIAFLPRSNRLLLSRLQSSSAVILEPPKIKSVTVSIVFSSICHEVMGPDVMTLVFWMLSFKPNFSLPSFTFIKRFFSPSSISAIRVVSSAYLRLLTSLPVILISACALSSLAFRIMYSEVKWNEVKLLSCVWLFATTWIVAYQDPQSMGFSKQEYWSGLPFPSPGDLPDLGIEPGSPAL